MTTLNNLNAEILEFVVNENSKVTNYKIKDLDFPRTAIIGGVIKEGKGIMCTRRLYHLLQATELLFVVYLDLLSELKVYFYKTPCIVSIIKLLFFLMGVLLLFNGGLMLFSALTSYIYSDGVTFELTLSSFIVLSMGRINDVVWKTT